MSDYINRQDAIDAVAKILSEREGGNAVWWKPVAESAIDVLPSAQRTGEWIHDGSDWTNRWICSKCGYKWVFDKSNFCPNCGSYNGSEL